jgi:hypothetical protein
MCEDRPPRYIARKQLHCGASVVLGRRTWVNNCVGTQFIKNPPHAGKLIPRNRDTVHLALQVCLDLQGMTLFRTIVFDDIPYDSPEEIGESNGTSPVEVGLR